MIFIIFLGSKLKLSLVFLFNQLKKALSLIKPYLTTSAYPAKNSFRDKLLRVFGSINTADG